MKPRALRLLLITVLLSVQIATVGGVMLGVQRVHTDKYTADSYSRVRQMATVFADQTRRFLQPVESNLEETQRLISSGQLDPTDSQAVELQLLSQLRMTRSIRGLILAHADGSFVSAGLNGKIVQTSIGQDDYGESLVSSTRYSAEGKAQDRWLDLNLAYDPRTRPWYEVAMQGRNVQWTEPYSFFATDVPGLSAATKIRDAEGKPAGVLAIHIGLRELSEFIAVIPDAVDASAAVINEHFGTLAYSDPDTSLRDARGGMLPLRALGDEPLLALQAATSNADGRLDENATGFIRFSSGGQEHLGFARPLPIVEGQMEWTLMVQAPASAYSGALKADIRRSLWWLLGLIVISSAIAVAAILQLTAPVFHLHRLATRDRLTGALSRAEFERRLARLMLVDRRRPRVKSVLIALDLDGFKQVNDRFGHSAGDQVLIEFVRRLRARLRREDLIARLGGDEFVVALQLHGVDDHMAMIERIRQSLVQEPMATTHGALASAVTSTQTIGVTAGVAVRHSDESIESWHERADQALVAGKSDTKNRSYEAPTSSLHAFCDALAEVPAEVPAAVVEDGNVSSDGSARHTGSDNLAA